MPAALLLALAVLVAPLVPALHHAEVAHQRCAEHNELVHAEHGATTPAPAGSPAESREVRPADGEGDHHHCEVTQASLPQRTPASSSLAWAPLDAPADHDAAPKAAAAPRMDVVRLAPKQGPPRRA